MSIHIPHTAKAVLFTCIDDRLNETSSAFIQGLNGGAFHPSLAGGGLAFLDDAYRASALQQIIAAYKINHITDIYLQSHTDCGAYRLSGVTFASPEDELRRLYADLDQAATIIRPALAEAGAAPDEVAIHLEVVDPTGQPQSRP
jgi:carbonic anhydrase